MQKLGDLRKHYFRGFLKCEVGEGKVGKDEIGKGGWYTWTGISSSLEFAFIVVFQATSWLGYVSSLLS
jgi:hypothetical protein